MFVQPCARLTGAGSLKNVKLTYPTEAGTVIKNHVATPNIDKRHFTLSNDPASVIYIPKDSRLSTLTTIFGKEGTQVFKNATMRDSNGYVKNLTAKEVSQIIGQSWQDFVAGFKIQ